MYASNPILDGYPEGTAFVYRSADMYGNFRAAGRMNTNIVVFSDQAFADIDAALAYLQGLGLVDIIEEAGGSVVLVTPAKPDIGFTASDKSSFAKLQTAMLALKASVKVGDQTTFYSDAEYFGGYGYEYYIGIDGGASFLNNYVATEITTLDRIAGMLLINGTMQDFRNVASYVPVYLVNAQSNVIAKYQAANDTNTSSFNGDLVSYFNQALPLKKVIVAQDENPDAAAYIQDVYYNLFIKAMRCSPTGELHPFSLCARSAILDGGNTPDGVNVTYHLKNVLTAYSLPMANICSPGMKCCPPKSLTAPPPTAASR